MDVVVEQLGGGRLEQLITDLYDSAEELFRENQELHVRLSASAAAEDKLRQELARMKQDQKDAREAAWETDKRAAEERSVALLEMERLKTANDELRAKAESFRFQHEQLQQQQQQHKTGGQPIESSSSHAATPQQQQQQQQRVSHLVTREVIDQLNQVHDTLKAMEQRTLALGVLAKQADARAQDMARALQESKLALAQASEEVAALRSQHRELQAKARSETAVVSSLRMDLDVSHEQTNRLREEVSVLARARRELETELSTTKLTVANSLLPLLKQAQEMAPPPAMMTVTAVTASDNGDNTAAAMAAATARLEQEFGSASMTSSTATANTALVVYRRHPA